MQNDRKTYNWERILKVKGGHRYFRDLATGRISVCDDSGDLPHETDDGVLWLDFGRNLTLQHMNHDGRCLFFVPVVRESGLNSHAFASVREAMALVREFGMDIVLTDGDDRLFMQKA